MNFTEGTRRLALLAGAFGVICGSFGSYLELKPALQQKAIHDRFERLAASDDVTKERKCRLLGGAAGCSLDPNADIKAIAQPSKNPPGWEDVPAPKDDFADIAEPTLRQSSMRTDWKRMSEADQKKVLKSLTNAEERTRFAIDMGWVESGTKGSAQKGVDYDALAAKYGGVDDPYANLPDPTVPHWTPPASELDGKEIKTIDWGEGKDYTVESIVTEDGNTLHATYMPSRWIYFWAIIFPIAGFVIPWGLIRSVQWVAAGFVATDGSS